MINYCYLTQLIDTSSVSSKTYITSVNVTKNFCRFCQKTEGLKFKKLAHAIPYSVGNKFYVHREECDSCNDFFSKYENSFSNHFSLYCVAKGIPGRNGYKKIKDNKSSMKFDPDSNSLYFECEQLDLANLKPFYIQQPKCNEWNFFRILLKIVYTFLPFNELPYYEFIRSLLHMSDTEFKKKIKKNCQIFFNFSAEPVEKGIKLFSSPLDLNKGEKGYLFILIVGSEVYTILIFSDGCASDSYGEDDVLDIVYMEQNYIKFKPYLYRKPSVCLTSESNNVISNHFSRKIQIKLIN